MSCSVPLGPLANAALGILRQALRSLARRDSEFDSIMRQLITHMKEGPRTITTSLDFIWIVSSVERNGDLARHVAEPLALIVGGRDICHPEEENKA